MNYPTAPIKQSTGGSAPSVGPSSQFRPTFSEKKAKRIEAARRRSAAIV